MSLASSLTLNDDLDVRVLAEAFAQDGRLHIPGILEADAAQRLHSALSVDPDWVLATLTGGEAADIPLGDINYWSPQRQAAFAEASARDAAAGFHFMFDSLRLTALLKSGQRIAPLYRDLHDFLNGPIFLAFARALTRDDRIRHADVQATRFRPGHYLNAHDDDRPGVGRLYAYVLNLTPDWRADFGGLLTFLDDAGHVSGAWTPMFNALNIFRVPQEHAVSPVARFAAGHRLSITGWLRQDDPPILPH